ncbi:ubiquitin carboxyl-terminal hydrolase 31-like [Argiope bruennichi]|uniref:ubiquitin carboxyl-terminal hydrolase 31-like n=1 Tax=Argiope bruennichi TaxID=94029 RepID=UPI00249516B9|nr:ubiquitin carboxyl-terminal hydrolase 31-like [Argiope bruennichi]
MSTIQYAECSRSVSDGDLTSAEKKKAKEIAFSENNDKQIFFTLPRWMSVRRKKNKIKYVKVDVPFNSNENEKRKYESLDSKNIEKEKHREKSSNFIRKLFRSNSFFSSNSSKNANRNLSKVPTSPSLFSSNSDMRCSSAFNFNSIDYQEYFKDKIPAVCGLKNHGNTCFMNAVIQCLSNTDMFAEYFVMDHFKIDLLRRNKTHSKRYGTRGEVTEQLAALLKSLWSCQYYGNISNKFKHSVAKYGNQYEGNEQHDAQEFLLWLLDKVHEDLNTAPKEKYKKTKGNLGRSDEDIAAEMLANHLRCNSSFIHDLFQGQFRSSLCCLGCGRFSNTFDPYLCVSLPIPTFHTIPVYLYIIFLNEKVKMNKVGILIDSQATVYDFREKLSTSFKTSKENLLLLEIINGEFERTFCDSDLVADFKDSKHLYAIETPPGDKNVSMESEKICLVISNKIEKESSCEMLWRPFVLDVTREISYSELMKIILEAMRHPFENIFDLDLENCFSLCIIDGEPVNETICSSVDMPLYMPAIDKALMLCTGAIPHVKLSIVWNKVAKDIFPMELNFIEEHASVNAVRNSRKQSDDITLKECFDLYFNEERLESEDAWVCAYCHHRLPCVKSLSLWTIPDVFIVHLKRFRQSASQRLKMTTFVNFPFSGLDMSPYITTRNQNVQQMHNNSSSLAFWSPWKRPRYRPYSRLEDNVYELYAVCNHHGSMQGGHYTAYCRNPVNGHWYHFDDTKVQEVQASEVISADAYILFYQRSSLISHSCASSSSSGYSSASSTYSVGPEHWAFHMAAFFRDVPITSKSQDSLYDAGKTASLDRRTIASHRPFDRSMKAYSTLHPPSTDKANAVKLDLTDSNINYQENKSVLKDEIPPPPPPARHYWTVTSV